MKKSLFFLLFIFISIVVLSSILITIVRDQKLRQTYPRIDHLHQRITNLVQPLFYNCKSNDNLKLVSSYRFNDVAVIKKYDRFLSSFAPRHHHSRLTSFLGSFDNNIYLFTSNGLSSVINLDSKKINSLNNNLKDLIDYPDFFLPYPIDRHGVKDVLVNSKGNIFLSVTDRDVENNCTYVKILFSEGIINNSLSKFKLIFSSDCVNLNKGQFHNDVAHMLGARISFGNDEQTLFLALGMLNNFNLPQNDNNSYGKILSFRIDLKKPILNGVIDSRVKVHAKGIRNPQGLDYDSGKIIMSSHGPKGGDVINLIDLQMSLKQPLNFGFPIVSYGTHYDGSFSYTENQIGLDVALSKNNKAPDYAPFYQDPKKYGYEEALKFYTPSVAPSQISIFNKKEKKYIVLATMGYRKTIGQESIHFYKFIDNKIKDSIIIPLNGRIRDFEIINDDIYYWDETNSILGSVSLL